MFTSTKEFDAAVFSILKNIMNGESNFFNNLEIDEDDAYLALERAIDLCLIQGVSLKRAVGNNILVSKSNPRLSYEGLAFVERHGG